MRGVVGVVVGSRRNNSGKEPTDWLNVDKNTYVERYPLTLVGALAV